VVIPITVGRDKSIRLIKDYYKGDRIIGAVAQKDPGIEDPEFSDLNLVGTVAYILKILQMPMVAILRSYRGKEDLPFMKRYKRTLYQSQGDAFR